MSAKDKPLPPGAALYLWKLLADDEAKRIASLTHEELEAETEAEGPGAWKPDSTDALLARVKAAAERSGVPIAAAPVRRLPRMVWFAAAAALLLVAGIAAVKGPEIVAHFRAPSIRPDDNYLPEEPPSRVAARLREEAQGLCEQGQVVPCEAKLDEARRVDPAGEADPRVMDLRQEIEMANHPAPEKEEKPRVPEKPPVKPPVGP